MPGWVVREARAASTRTADQRRARGFLPGSLAGEAVQAPGDGVGAVVFAELLHAGGEQRPRA